jgi:hypothetical protein
MNHHHRAKIAERLRGLIAGQDSGDLAVTARRLGVDEVSLRISIDELSPYPTVDVIAAIVNHYGVDPGYLISGRYDGRLHQKVLDEPAAAKEAVRKLAEDDATAPHTEPPQQPRHLHLA